MSSPNIKLLLRSAIRELKAEGIDTAELDAELLLSHVLGCSRPMLFLRDHKVSCLQERKFLRLLQERKAHKPVAYIIGFKEFWKYEFEVTQDVLIPRPETEMIIYLIQKLFPDFDASFSILDLGTGSGCLAITLLSEYQKSTACAVDISANALEVAKRNAVLHKVDDRLKFLHGSWFEPVPETVFHVIVSNPPYVGHNDNIARSVRDFEPYTALYSDNNGLEHYIKIAEHLDRFMGTGSVALLEIGAAQGAEIIDIFCERRFSVSIEKDLSGLDRIATVKK